ncbi:MAG: ECF-type sigma factor [Bacteroidota bacterium]
MSSVPTLLSRAREGDADAFREVVGRLYGELRQVARSQRRRLSASDTINTTAVVHEAYARLDGGAGPPALNDRGHFFRVAAAAMRGVIVDYARRQSRQKRGGNERPVPLDLLGPVADGTALDLDQALSLDAALGRLAAVDEETARVVELRYFGGLTIEETAEALALSPATVTRRWTFARAWLRRALAADGPGTSE